MKKPFLALGVRSFGRLVSWTFDRLTTILRCIGGAAGLTHKFPIVMF